MDSGAWTFSHYCSPVGPLNDSFLMLKYLNLNACQRSTIITQKTYESLKKSYDAWENEAEANDQGNGRALEFLENVHTNWDKTSEYFIKLEQDKTQNFVYMDLVASHIGRAVNYWGDGWKNIREGKARDHYGLCDWMAEGMHMYWDYLPLIAKDMAARNGVKDEYLVHEAWIMMIFRAFCWWRCHWMTSGKDMIQEPLRIPSRYWESKFPVYIG